LIRIAGNEELRKMLLKITWWQWIAGGLWVAFIAFAALSAAGNGLIGPH
jgi:uncharacterized membrane protein YdcZ (DUF606 family)